MNLKFIDKAIAAYGEDLPEDDRARLDYFRGLWQEMERWTKSPSAAVNRYTVPTDEVLEAAWNDDRAVFSFAAPKLSKDRTAAICGSLRAYVCESGMLSKEDQDGLAAVDFTRLITSESIVDAASNPQDFLGALLGFAAEEGCSESVARLVVLVALLALRVDFEPIAKAVKKRQPKNEASSHHPLVCPVCGSDPALARVGGGDSPTEGRGRTLYCQQCGNDWAFERIRCARCGTNHQGKLHYYNLEGNDGHRIATCDECGGYIRTVFLEERFKPFSYEVEEVVTARLDAVARDPRFQTGEA